MEECNLNGKRETRIGPRISLSLHHVVVRSRTVLEGIS